MIQVDIQDSGGINVISFNTGAADANGVFWWVTALEGWDLPDPRQKFLPRVQDHGDVVGESFLGSRAITLGGLVQCPSIATWWSSQYLLKRAVTTDIAGGVNFGKMVVHEVPGGGTSTQRYVSFKLAGRPKFKLDPGSWQFAVPLTCPDPHLYLMDGSDAGVGVF